MYYLFVVSHSDGNNQSHTDCIVKAVSSEKAHEKLWKHYKRELKGYDENFSDPPCLEKPIRCSCICESCSAGDCSDCDCDAMFYTTTIPYECNSFGLVYYATKHLVYYHGYLELIDGEDKTDKPLHEERLDREYLEAKYPEFNE